MQAKKHGMDEFISADPVKDFDHDALFAKLQSLTLDYRLQELICSLVRSDCNSFEELYLHRAGFLLAKYLCSMNTAHGIWCVVVTGKVLRY